MNAEFLQAKRDRLKAYARKSPPKTTKKAELTEASKEDSPGLSGVADECSLGLMDSTGDLTGRTVVLVIGLTVVIVAMLVVSDLRKEKQWIAQAVSEGCRIVDHVGSHARPEWSCPKRGLVLQPNR